jgi:nicotinamide-nucleotide amidase
MSQASNLSVNPPTVALLLVGSELLDGRILDTNKQYLGTCCRELGISVAAALTCKDDEGEIVAAINYLSKRSQHIICSGGLGPTSDDLTREAVAAWSDSPLELDQEVLTWLRELYQSRKRSFDESNVKQALFPKGAKVIPNPVGTAAGFSMSSAGFSMSSAVGAQSKGSTVYCLPGVPRELKEMLSLSVIPEILSSHTGFTPLVTKGLRSFGLPESVVGSLVKQLNLPSEIQVSFLASFPEIKVTLTAPYDPSEYLNQIETALGKDRVFSREINTSLEMVTHDLLVHSGKSLALAESCTGGMVSQLLTDNPGSSAYLLGGVVCYSNQSKQQQLGVQGDTLGKYGAVSHQVVRELAAGVRERFHSSLGVSISGVAGPSGGSELKPVGTFFIGLDNGNSIKSYGFFLSQSRPLIRRFAAYKALDVIRRELLGLPAPSDALPEE